MPHKFTRANYDAIRSHLFDCIHKNGEQFKNNLPNIIRTAIEAQAYKQFVDLEGNPFENVVEWMQRPFPVGLGMGQDRHSLSFEDVLQLTKAAPDVHRVLVESPPKGKPGPPGKNGKELTASTQLIVDRNRRGHSATVLSIRLAQEKPKFYDAFMLGKYKSVTGAAIAAGLMKNDGNMRRAKSAYRKMSAEERKEFHQWMKKPD